MRTSPHTETHVAALHEALVEGLKQRELLQAARVEAAFRAVPRHLFLPDVPIEQVYQDEAIATKFHDGVAISSSSQPSIMAIMLQQLGVEPGHRVLEIGAGTGYNAALLAHMAGDSGQVVTVDIDEDIVAGARDHLAAAGFDRVAVVQADGGEGYAVGAPYDRIILTVAAGDITPAWREQLAPGGRLVLPLAIRGGVHKAVAFEHAGDHLASASVRPCGFMVLRGAFASAETRVQLGPQPDLSLTLDGSRAVDSDALYARLTGAVDDRPTGVSAARGEIWAGLDLWLALHEPDLCSLQAAGELAELGYVPCLFGYGGQWKSCFTKGVLRGTDLCLLAPPPGTVPSEQLGRSEPFELFVRDAGADPALAGSLIAQIRAWDAAGRPASKGLRIRAYPTDAAYRPAAGAAVVEKRWSRLVFDWPALSPVPSPMKGEGRQGDESTA